MIEVVGQIAQDLSKESLLFAAALFCVIGAEDFAFDLIWIINAARNMRTRHRSRGSAITNPVRTQFAILVPVWDEGQVIGSMIDRAVASYGRKEFTIFVGAYPNDPATLDVLRDFDDRRVVPVLNSRNGPTSKGDALNTAWQGMVIHEMQSGTRFDFIVLHDAEDEISAGEPDVFAEHGQQFEFMQIPVVPVAVGSSRWIAGHYCDEFAEAHLKSLVVRQILDVSIPSAGVGTAIGRVLLDRIAEVRGGLPFSPDSLTEDYELGLLAGDLGASAAFLRVVNPADGSLVCVRSRFPETLSTSVRQKARWIAGIAFAGWDRIGWTAAPMEIWVRWRDRRALFEAAALVAGYGGAFFAACALVLANDVGAGLQDDMSRHLLAGASVFMLWRLAVRVGCTAHVYGWREGMRALPRVVISNLIAVLATVRAIRIYWRMRTTGRIIWDKTQHDFTIRAAS